jgi:hypothetical protein
MDVFLKCVDPMCTKGLMASDWGILDTYCENGHYVNQPSDQDAELAHEGAGENASSRAGLAGQKSNPLSLPVATGKPLADIPFGDSPIEARSEGRGNTYDDEARRSSEEGFDKRGKVEVDNLYQSFVDKVKTLASGRPAMVGAILPETIPLMALALDVLPEALRLSRSVVNALVHATMDTWHPNAYYFKGDILHQQKFGVEPNDVRVSIVANRDHARSDPIRCFTQPGEAAPAWCMVLRYDGEIMILRPGQDLFPMTEQLSSLNTILCCSGCGLEHLKNHLLNIGNEPEQGACTHCGSIEFHPLLGGDATEIPSDTIVFDRRYRRYHLSISSNPNALDLEKLWAEFLENGTFSIAKDADLTYPDGFEEMLRLELQLHRSGAELYAKLRSIPLSTSDDKLQMERAYSKLRVIRQELLNITEQL